MSTRKWQPHVFYQFCIPIHTLKPAKRFLTSKNWKEHNFYQVMYCPGRVPSQIRPGLHTSKKCGRRRPIEYLAISVVNWLIAAPNPNTPTCLYVSCTHPGTVYFRITSGFSSSAFLPSRNSITTIYKQQKLTQVNDSGIRNLQRQLEDPSQKCKASS